MIPFVDLKAQYVHLKQCIDNRIEKVLLHGQYIMGPEVYELEENLADYVGVKHAVTCANGTDALQLCLMALDIKSGDAVFCPTFTFFASAEVIPLVGASPVFVDSDPNTFNICPINLEKQIANTVAEGKLTPKAIIAVDLFGLPANYSELERIAKKYQLKIIEDAAQGFGGEINKKRAGSFGNISTTSFFPSKPLGCYGDGGAIFTDNDEYAALLRSLRVHGQGHDKYDNVRIGLNSRLDTLQAAVLLEKLKVFPKELHVRAEVAQSYNLLIGNKFITPFVPEGYKSSWAQYTLKGDDRDSVITKLDLEGIPTGVYYKVCVHQQAAFNISQQSEHQFPIAEHLANSVFSLPMHPYLSSEQFNSISYAIEHL